MATSDSKNGRVPPPPPHPSSNPSAVSDHSGTVIFSAPLRDFAPEPLPPPTPEEVLRGTAPSASNESSLEQRASPQAFTVRPSSIASTAQVGNPTVTAHREPPANTPLTLGDDFGEGLVIGGLAPEVTQTSSDAVSNVTADSLTLGATLTGGELTQVVQQDDEPASGVATSGRLSGNIQLDDAVASGKFGTDTAASLSTRETITGHADQTLGAIVGSGAGSVGKSAGPRATNPAAADPNVLTEVHTDLELKYNVEGQAGSDVGTPTIQRAESGSVTGSLSVQEEGQDTFTATATVVPAAGRSTTSFASEPYPNETKELRPPATDQENPTSIVQDGLAPGARLGVSASLKPGSAFGVRNIFVPDFNNDEATSGGRSDVLDVKADAAAFAQIAVSRTTQPPLAVGVFGSWGAGKSFFMDLVHGQVASISEKAKPSSALPAFGQSFHDKVIQIRFNAWHYAETNLWASLVGHIFQELSASIEPTAREDVFGKLSTARQLTLEASSALVLARKEQHTAKEALEEAKASFAAVQARPVRTVHLFTELIIGAFGDTENQEIATARQELKEAASGLGLGALVSSTEELTEEGAALLRQGVQAKDVFWSIAKNLGSPLVATLFVFGLIAAPLLAIATLRAGADYLNVAQGWLSEALVSSAALATIVAAWFKKAAGPMLAAIDKLKAAKARVDSHVSKNLEKYEKVVANNEAAVAKAAASVQAASDLLKATTARVAQAREDLHGQSAAGRLINFVRDRASRGEYAKHLGLISTIRKDFEELSNFVSGKTRNPQGSNEEEIKAIRRQIAEILAQAREGRLLSPDEIAGLKTLAQRYEAKPLPFERIVLYIDDVDRCAPAKVVEVLQAVHMLLAFRLFVVFVAVDVRWVGSSLAQQYQGMLKDVNASIPLTSASDYLEKIFQIPYWLPAVNRTSSDTLVSQMLPATKRIEPASSGVRTGGGEASTVNRPAPAIEDRFHSIEFEEREIEQIQAFARLLDSPRKVIRFTNVVRFLRARDRLGQSFSSAINATPILAQLAIATASPESYSLWQMVARAYRGKAISEIVDRLELGYLSRYPVIHTALKAFQDWSGADVKVDVLLEFDGVAGRMSFAAPLPDSDGKLFAVIKKYVDNEATDFPLVDEIKARSLSEHAPASKPGISHWEAN